MLEQILSLPIEKKIGQLFFIGLSGTEMDANTRELLQEISPGGVCLFARNIRQSEQTRNLLDEIREISTIEPLLSIDQEGGQVDRLRRVVEPMPSASSLKNADDAKKLAEITAETIRILGFNMNFAPVVDVIDEARAKSNNGLYSRSFGNSKEEGARFASAYLENLEKNGCLGCLKHFPGLGASAVDSHEELPQVFLSQNELIETDLFPYREIFSSIKPVAVMIAHASFPKTDLQETDQNGKLLPSSLSSNFTNKLLREELGFEGIAVTDDLEMGAILKNYGIGEACKLAILAGEDMLSICGKAENIREGFKAVSDAVKSGEISEARIDESLKRIAVVKNLINSPLPFNENRLRELSGEIVKLKERINL
jgi:beta-N-acetylhexosaminidase